MMSLKTKQEIAKLSAKTKSELRGFFRNKLAIISGMAQLLEKEEGVPPMSQFRLRTIIRTTDEFVDEFERLLEGK